MGTQKVMSYKLKLPTTLHRIKHSSELRLLYKGKGKENNVKCDNSTKHGEQKDQRVKRKILRGG